MFKPFSYLVILSISLLSVHAAKEKVSCTVCKYDSRLMIAGYPDGSASTLCTNMVDAMNLIPGTDCWLAEGPGRAYNYDHPDPNRKHWQDGKLVPQDGSWKMMYCRMMCKNRAAPCPAAPTSMSENGVDHVPARYNTFVPPQYVGDTWCTIWP